MAVDFVALYLLGLISGTTVCSIGCLSQLGPYILGSAKDFREGFCSTLSYLIGKFFIYLLWGGIAAWAGIIVALPGNGTRWAGLVLIATGILLPFFNRGKCPAKLASLGNRWTLFTLGAVTSLMPCPPLLGLLALAAGSGSVTAGMASGASFGLGILCSPLVIAGGGLGLIAGRLRLELNGLHKIFQGFAMLMLITMGIRLFLVV